MTDILDAIFKCDLRKLKILLPDRKRANQVIPGTEGCTALHLVVGIESTIAKEKVLTYLLNLGASPNARSYDDLTPVHIAAMWNNCYELEMLLQNGGDPWLLDKEDKNSFSLSVDNHSFEAFQLLNKYLSEDKLNFRKPSTESQNSNYFDVNNLKSNSINATTDDNFVNTKFFSACENIPFYFSSTDDESDDLYYSVSRILKKDYDMNQQNQNDMNRQIDVNGKERNRLTVDTDESCYSADFNNKVTETQTDTEPFSSDETEIYSTSENEYILNETDSSETVVDTDNESGISLVEKSIPSKSFVYDSADKNKFDCHISGWRAHDTQNTSCSSWSICSSHSMVRIVTSTPNEYKAISNSKIYQELKRMGDNPGPVSDSTRQMYLRRLARLKMGCDSSCILPAPKYCPEMYKFLEGKFDADKIQNRMNILTEEFNSIDPHRKWREGNQRCCFNYFLLDPRVTQNLPMRLKQMTFEKAFLTFVDALFYVGKGTRGRPYNHLLEAIKAASHKELKNDKINHILDIWESGLGVISLHCFNNCIPVEAYTQEACVIEAVGLENLTNIKVGDYYGIAAKWKRSWKRQIGITLLHRALQIFILEGEKQIMPKDIRTR